MVWSAFANRFKQPRRNHKERRQRTRTAVRDHATFIPSLGGEWLEDRALLANASLVGNDLQIDFTFTGSTSEAVTIASDGTNYTLGGDITGTTSFSVASVNKITLSASGNGTAQSMTFQGGTTFTLSQGLASTGVDSVTVSRAINAGGGSAAISVTAPGAIDIAANLTAGSGGVTLNANAAAATGNLNAVTVQNGATVTTTGGGSTSVTGISGAGSGGYNLGVYVLGGSTITASSGGTVTVAGTGGSGSGGSNFGVFLQGGVITSGGGNVSVTGQGGSASSGGYHVGVAVTSAGTITAGGSGTVTVAGTGGAGDSSNNWGVYVANGNSKITSSGGTVSVTGQGGGGSTGSEGYGVLAVDSGSITSGGGSINVTAIGNTGTSPAAALYLQASASIASGSNAPVTITSDSVKLDSGASISSGSGTTTIQPRTSGTLINLGGADVLSGAPLTLGLTDAELDLVTAGTLGLGSTSAGTLTISAPISPANTNSLSLKTGSSISGSTNTLTVGTLALEAATGISVTTAVTTFSSITNSTSGQIVISQTGAFAVPAGFVTTGKVQVTATGDITVGNPLNATGRTVILTSTGGSINGGSLITGNIATLAAATGIGNTTALSLAAPTISADSTAGKINLANALSTAVTVSSLTTTTAVDPGGALITFNQSGGGTVTFNSVSTDGSAALSGWGAVSLVNNGGGITIASSGVTTEGSASSILLVTTGSGNIAVNAPLDARLNGGDVSLIAAGSITGSGLMTGYTGSLVANTGINANASVSQGFATITSAAGDINVTNVWGIAVPNAITTTGNVTLTSGQNIVLSNPITATGKTVTLTANNGDIAGISKITANTVDLNATTGIGTTGVIELAAFFVSADTTAGPIDINNTSGTAVSITSLTTSGASSITFDQTGGGGIGITGPVTTGTGNVTITSPQAISVTGSGLITTGGTLDASAVTGLALQTAVTTFGAITTTGGPISITQTDALDLPSLTLAASQTLTISASGAITQQSGSVLSVPSGSASFTASVANADVILAESNIFGGTINVTTSGTASVEINDSGTTSLGTLSLGTGTLNVTTSGAITQTAAIVQAAGAGAATFETSGALITLTNTGNDFTGPVNLRNSGAKNISIVDSSGLILGAVSQATTQANTLAVTVLAGNITQQAGTAISIGTGGATFTAANGSDIILDAASNALNGSATFAPIVGVGNQLRNLSFTNGKAIQVPNGLDISGSLVITASGNITDGTPFTVGGSSTFQTLSSSANITLTGDNQYNGLGGSFNLATVGSGSASVTGTTKAIALGTVDIGGTLTVETADAVTDAGLINVIGATSLKGSSITLDTVGSKYTGALSLESTVGNTSVSGTASAVNLGTVSVAGDLAVSSALAITNSGKFTVVGASAFTTTANNASITLDGSAGGSASSFSGLVSFSAHGTGSAALTNVTGPLGISTATFGGTLTLSASGTITTDASGSGITGTGVGIAGAITITSSAGNIVLDEPLASGGGNVTLTATLGSVSSSASSGGADVAGTISTTAAANSGSGSGFLVITAGNAINLQAAVSTSSSNNNAGGAGAAGNITFNAQSISVTQAITAIGGSNVSAVAGSGGSAGAVTLTASNGAISVVDITATGGTGIKAVGGGGGSVLLQTTGGAGTITVAAVTTTGGKGGTGFNSGNAGNIEFDSNAAALITLNGDLIAIGGSGVVQGSGGNISVQDKAVITRNTTVDTGVTAGDVVFNSSVHSVSTTPYSLTVTAGDGSVTFVGELGAPITGLLDNRLLSLSASGAAVTINKSVSTTGAAGISVSATSITIGNGGSADTVVFNTNAAAGGGATANGVVSLNSTTTTLTDNLTLTRGTGAITFSNETLAGGDYDLTINGTGTDTTGGNISFLGNTSDLGSVSLSQVGILVVGTGGTNLFSADDFVYADTGTGTATFNAATTMQTSAGPGLVVSTAGTVQTNEWIYTTNSPITITSTLADVDINTGNRGYSTTGGAITITGKGVTQDAQHEINAGSGIIIVDGDPSGTDPGAIVLSGVLTTTYASPGGESDYAVLLRDATTVTFNGITASSGVVQIGTAGISPADVTGNVTQTSNNNAGLVVNIFAANTGSNITVNGSNNNANNIANLATITLPNVLYIRDDANGVNVLNNLTAEKISILTRGGNLAIGNSNISTTTGTIFLQGQGVTQGAGSTITPGTITASTVIVDASDFRFGQGFSAVNMAGTITTTSTASPAVTFSGASTIVLPQVNATGAGSSVQINDGNTSSGAVSQTTGKILNVTTVNVNTRGSVTLDQSNTITNVSGITYGGAVAVNDLAGLTLTGAIGRWTTGTDNVAVTTTGLLDLNGQNVTGSNVTLTGVSVTSSGGTVSGTGTITIDAQDGSINLTGTSLTTGLNNGTVQLLDAGGNVVIGSITTNTGGSVVLGGSGGDVLTGNVTQIAAINTGTLSGNVGGSVTLTNGGNTFGAIGDFTAGAAITIVDSTLGLDVSGAVTNANGGLVSLTTSGAAGLNVTATGSINGSGVTLDNLSGGISIAGTIQGNAGTVTLNGPGGFNTVAQSGLGIIKTTGVLTGASGGATTLSLANEIGSLGPYTITGAGSAFAFNDAAGGLLLAGDITVNTGNVTITTAGGALDLDGHDVVGNAGSTATFALTGVGIIQDAGSTIDAGTGLITLDANTGNIVMAGVTDTASASTSAITIRDAAAVQLGTVTASLGTVTIGVSADVTGAVIQVGPLAANKLVVNTAGAVNLASNSGNTIDNLNGIVTLGNFSLRDSTLGLILLANVAAGDGSNAGAVSLETLGGSLQVGAKSITAYGNISLQGAGITQSAGSTINANASDILMDGDDGTTEGGISLLGTVTTTSNSGTAVLFRDAASVAVASITTGSTGTTTFGGSGANGITGGITQTGPLVTGTLAGNSGQVTLTNASNQVAFLGPYTSSSAFALKDSTGGLTFSGDVVTDGTTTITTPGALNLATYDLWALNSGSVTNFSQLTLTAVGIAQSATAGTSSIKADTTAFIAATGDIDLLNPDNDFTGTVTLKSTGAFVAVRDANNMTLSTLGGNIGSNTAVKGIAGATLVLATENLSTGTGYVYLESEGGNLTTTGTITTSTGDITLKSSDAVTGYLLTINHAVSSTSAGDIVLVGGKIEHNAQDVTTTGAGTISATALTGNLTMVNGTVYSTGSGAITMTAADDIELAVVTTTGNVTLTATGGAVIDVLTGETANITGNVVTITASTGIGTSDGGTTIDDIETTAAELDLTSTTGGIYVNNIGAVQLGNATGGVNTVTSGDIVITATGAITTGGTITTGGGNGDISISNTAGAITLSNAVTANGSGDVTVTATGALAVDANVTTTSGAVALTGAGVTQATATTINAGSGTVTIDAQASTIDLDGSIVSTGSGTVVTIRDASTVALGTITAANGTIAIGVNDISGAVTQNTGLVITADTLTVDTNAAATLTNTNVIANLGAVTTSGNFALTDAGGLTLTGASNAGGTYTITTTGLLDLDGNGVTATGNVALTSVGITQAAGSTVNAGSGTIAVNSGGGVIDMAGTLSTTSSSSTAVLIRGIGSPTNSLPSITATSGTVVIGQSESANGVVGQTTGTSIKAATFTADLPTSLQLGSTTNLIGTLDAITIASGTLEVNDSAGGLTVAGPVSVGGNASISTVGGLLTITGNLSNAGSDLTLSGTGINQTGGTITTRNASISGNGGNVSLEQSGNNFTGAVGISNTGSATTAIVDSGAIQLGLVGVGTGTLTITAGGAITQNNSGITTGGAVVLDATGGVITLSRSNNDFGGAVSAANTGGGLIQLRDANAIQLGAISASGGLLVAAVSVTQDSSGITVAGNATFDAGAGAVTLTDADNDFQGRVQINNSGANNVAITDKNAIQFGASTLGSGTFTVNAVGITQAAPIEQAASAGAVTLNGGAAAITLTNPGNDFTGPVAANNTGANAIQITDAGALILGAVTTANNLTIVAGGAVTQDTGTALDVDGATSVTATGFAITLTNTGNDFGGAVSLTGQNVAVYDSTSLLLGPSVATGTYAATANTGDITQVAPPAAGITATGTATFTANGTQANILLNNATNSFAGGVSFVAGDANNITIIDTSASQLILSAISITGNLTIQANGITQTGTVAVAGKTSLTSTGGNIDLGSPFNDFDTIEVTTTFTPSVVTISDADGITFLASSLGTGGFEVNAASIAQTGAITQEASAGAVSLTARAGTLVLDRLNAFTGTVSANTTDGNAISLTNSTAITLGVVTASPGTATTGGNITITANGINAVGGTDSIATTGGILLQPLSPSTTIGVAGGAGSIQFAQSVFDTTIKSGASSITIGQANQSGTITVGTVTFRDPTIIRAPIGSVSVTGVITGDDNASITISASPATVTLSSNIVTNGNAITIDNGSGGDTSVVLTVNSTLDTTNGGAVPAGAAITIRGTIAGGGTQSFSANAGTDGDVLITGAAGSGLVAFYVSGNDLTVANVDGVAGDIGVVATDAVGASDDASITLTGTTYRTTGTASTQFYGSGTVSTPRTLTLTGGTAGSTTTFTLSSNDPTDYVEITGNVDLNGRNMAVDTTNGGVEAGSLVIFNNSIDGTGTLAIDAGSTGVVSFSGVGVTTPLTGLTITNANSVTVSGPLSVGTLTLTDATDFIQVSGVLTLTGGLVTAAQPYDLTLLGGNNGTNSIAGTTTFLNTGDLTLGNQGTNDVFTFVGGVVAADPAAIKLNATIAATTGVITLGDADTLVTVLGAAKIGGGSTGAITLSDIQLNSAASITLGTGIANAIQTGAITGTAGGPGESVTINTTGAVTVTGAVGGGVGNLTVTNSGGATFQSGVTVTTATITDTTGTVAFQGTLTADSLVTAAKAYAVSLTGNGSTIANAVTFSNTGGLAFGDGGDTITFTGGVTVASTTATINGTVATTGTAASLGDITLAGNSVIDATGGISVAMITGGGFDLQLISGNADSTIRSDATGLGTVTLMSNVPSTGLVWFQNALVATDIVTFAQGYRVRLADSGTTTITNATKFLNTGTLRIGNVGTLATFTGGLDTTAGPSSTTTAGTIATTNTALTLGAAQLFADTTLISGSGAITVGSVSTPAGLILTLGNASQTGTATVTGNVSLAAGILEAAAGAFDVVLGGSTNTIGSGTFLNTGSLTVGTAGGTSTFGSGLTAKTQSAVNLAGVIEATNSPIALGDITLLANTTIRAGSGTIGTGAVSQGFGTYTLTLGSASQTGDITLGGNLTLDDLVTVAGAYGVQLSGAANDITQAVTFNNTFFVNFGANTTDVSLFRGGLSIAGLTGKTFLIGTVRSIGQPITLDNTYLTGNATIDTTNAGNVPTGATITLDGGVLLQGHTLTTIGGSGGSSSTNLVGATNLSNGDLVVQSGDLNIGTGAGTPAQVTVTQNTTLQVTDGSLNVSPNSTITATGNTLTLLADTITIASGPDSIVASKVTLAPATTSENVFLGTATGTGLVLGQTALDAIDAATIQIGQAGNTGDVTMGVVTLAGTTLLVVADGVGAGVVVSGLFTSTGSTASGVGLEITGSGATTLLNAGIVSATDVIITDALELGQNVTIDTSSGNADVTISGGTAGIFATSGESNSLVINAGTGTVALGSAAGFGDNGGAGALVENVTITAGATSIGANAAEIAGVFSLPAGTLSLAANLTADTIAISSTGGVTLAGNVVLAAPTGITVAGTIDGGYALTANSAGTTNLGGAIGGGTRLASLTTNAGGTTTLGGGSVKTTGGQTFNNAVTLSTNTALDSSSSGGITLAGTVDASTAGGSSLTVNTAGATTFGGIVGGTRSLSSVTTDATGTTAIDGGAITTTGVQTFNDAVTLGLNTTLTGTLVTLAQVTGNSKNLTIAGDTSLTGQVTGVANLQVSGTTLIGADVSTTGTQTYGGLVTLASNATLTGTTPTFTTGVAGAGNNLTLDFSGTTAIDGAKFTGIADLATGNGGSTTLTGTITTSGSQTYGDAVSLLAATTVASSGSGAIAFSNTVDGPVSLIVNTSGATTFGGAVGSGTALTSLVTDAGGTVAINGGSVQTSGIQTYNDAVTLGNNTTLTGSTITTAGTLTGGGKSFGVTGNAVIGGAVSGLSSLSVSGTSAINTSSIATTGSQTYGGTVTLGAPTVTLSGTDATFTTGVAGAGNSLVLTFSGTTALTTDTLSGVTNLTTNGGGTTTLAGTITTSGTQTYTDAVTLLADATTAGSTVTFGAVTGGGHDLTVDGNAVVGGTLSGVADLAVTGTTAVNVATIATTGSQTYDGSVTLGAPTVTFSGTEGSFSGGIAGAGNSLVLSFSGTTALGSGTVSGIDNLTSNGGGTTTLTGSITTSGTQTYTDAVTLLGDTTTKGSTVTFAAITGGSHDLTVDGNAVLGGAVSGVAALAVTGTTAANVATIATTGSQTYGGLVTLGAPTVTLSGTTATFTGGVAGAGNSIVLTFSGVTALDSSILSGINNLTSNGGGTTTLTGTIETTGTQTYSDAVTLLAATTTKGSTVSFADITGGGQALTVDGNAVFTGAASGLASVFVSGTTSLAGSLSTTGGQTFTGALTVGSPATLSASTFTSGSTISVGTSSLAIITDVLSLGGQVSGTGSLQIGPRSPTLTMGVGDGAPGGLQFPTSTLALLQDGFSQITLGNRAATGLVSVAATTFRDPIAIVGGGTLQLDGLIRTGLGTQAGSILLAADTLVLNAGVQTVGQNVTLESINGDVTISAGAIQTQAPLDSGLASGGIFIAVSGTGSVNLLSTLSTLGASNATGTGSDGGTISITTNTGSISVGSLITDGGASSANAAGGQAGAIVLSSGSGTPVTFNGGTLSAQGGFGVGGQPDGGNMSFGAVSLANAATVVTTGPTGGNIAFNGPVNGAQQLSLIAGTGTVTLGGQFGGTTPLSSFAVLSGATTISGDGVKTAGAQSYAAAVAVTGTPTLTSVSGGGLSFASTIDGPGALSLSTSGPITLSGAVGAATALTSLQTAGGGTTTISGAGVRTSGSQTYGNPLQLATSTVTLTGTTGTFSGGVTGGDNSLVLDFSGATVVDGAAFTGIRNLTTQGGGTTSLTGAVTTTGTQTYLDAVTLSGSSTLTGTTVTTGSTLTGGGNPLSVVGNAVLGGDVSGVTTLAVSGTTTVNAAAVSTTGTQSYGGVVTLGAPTVTFSGTTPSFTGGVNGQNNSLTLAFSGLTAINGSAFARINDLLVQNTGSTSLTGSLVTGGSQTYRNAVALAGGTALEGTRVDFQNTLDGARNLAVSATSGPVNFGAAVGGTTPLGSLAIQRATSVNAAGRVVLNGAATGADRSGLVIGAGVNNVTMTQTGNSVSGFVGNGVVLQGGSRASTFANFSISGNGESGFLVQAGDTAGTVIRDSSIGSNGFNGVWLNGATPSVTVTGNTLANNNNNGIVVSGPAAGVVVSNNTITGSGLTGIRTEVVANQAPSNMTISGNSTRLNQENGLIIAGNTGTTVSGNVVADNRLQGMAIVLGATQTSVSGNQIFNNGALGVVLSGATTRDNPILSNSIYGNRGGGIALLEGANRSQVAPTLKSARLGGGRITIAGTMRGQRGDVIRIQFFSNLAGDASSATQVQGRTLIGFRDVTLTGTSTNFSAVFASTGIASNAWISATATRLVSGSPTNTSQFSPGVRAR